MRTYIATALDCLFFEPRSQVRVANLSGCCCSLLYSQQLLSRFLLLLLLPTFQPLPLPHYVFSVLSNHRSQLLTAY